MRLEGKLFRRNPAFELVEYSQLGDAERDALRPLTGDADFYGVLRPLAPGADPPLDRSVDGAAVVPPRRTRPAAGLSPAHREPRRAA